MNTVCNLTIGAVRADGFLFRGYIKRVAGGKREHWISPAAEVKRKSAAKRLDKARRERVKADPVRLEKYNAYAAEYVRGSRRRNPKMHMLIRARCRAKARGLPFTIGPTDFDIPKYCPVLGISLRITKGCTDNSPTLDRINNTRGYVPGNVVVVSHRANRIKSNATLDELLRIAEFYSKQAKT